MGGVWGPVKPKRVHRQSPRLGGEAIPTGQGSGLGGAPQVYLSDTTANVDSSFAVDTNAGQNVMDFW